MSDDCKIFRLEPKQATFLDAALSGDYMYLLYGGAIRGGKTFTGLSALYTLCLMFPKSRWCVVRKDLPTLRRNTIPEFEKTVPPGFGRLNKQTWTCTHQNGSEIIFFPESFDTDKDLDRWKGLAVNGFLLEEANELNELAFHKANERAGTHIIDSKPPKLVLLTCNPADGWVKERFYLPWKDGTLAAPYYYLPANIFDNSHNDPEYIESLKSLPPEHYKRFVEGCWDSAIHPMQLIEWSWVYEAKKRQSDIEDAPYYLGVDPADTGEDDTVIALRKGNALVSVEHFSRLRTPQIVEKVHEYRAKYDISPENIRVDGVGIGVGVVNYLHEEGCECVNIRGGARPFEREDDETHYPNLRSQMWWELRELLRKSEIDILCDDKKLENDLVAPRYNTDDEKTIRVEPKLKMKTRLGRSPDAGDACAMAFLDVPEEGEFFFV